jgi:hypothetical protein
LRDLTPQQLTRAINATKRFGRWDYALINKRSDMPQDLDGLMIQEAAQSRPEQRQR